MQTKERNATRGKDDKLCNRNLKWRTLEGGGHGLGPRRASTYSACAIAGHAAGSNERAPHERAREPTAATAAYKRLWKRMQRGRKRRWKKTQRKMNVAGGGKASRAPALLTLAKAAKAPAKESGSRATGASASATADVSRALAASRVPLSGSPSQNKR